MSSSLKRNTIFKNYAIGVYEEQVIRYGKIVQPSEVDFFYV